MAADIFDYPVLDFSGDFIAGSGISDDDKKSLIPVGTVSIWTQDKVPEFWLECDGRAVDGVRYPELRKLMPFLPDYRDRFLQGTGINPVGERIEAGIPNLTGEFTIVAHNGNSLGMYGNFLQYARVIMGGAGNGFNPSNKIVSAKLDSSMASPVYRDDIDTVQPPAVIVKYIIKAE